MWRRSNLFQLSRDRWWWRRFCKLLGILLWAPINFFYGIQKGFSWLSYSTHTHTHMHVYTDMHLHAIHTCVRAHTHTHMPLPLILPTCVHLQTSTRYWETTKKMICCQLIHRISRSSLILNRGRKGQKHFLCWMKCLFPLLCTQDLVSSLKWIQTEISEFGACLDQGPETGENAGIRTMTKIILDP